MDRSRSRSKPLEVKDQDRTGLSITKCFHLAENSDDISEILDLLESNELLLHTWSYFQHCQQTAQKLEKEARFQKDLAESLLGDLRTLKINEIL